MRDVACQLHVFGRAELGDAQRPRPFIEVLHLLRRLPAGHAAAEVGQRVGAGLDGGVGREPLAPLPAPAVVGAARHPARVLGHAARPVAGELLAAAGDVLPRFRSLADGAGAGVMLVQRAGDVARLTGLHLEQYLDADRLPILLDQLHRRDRSAFGVLDQDLQFLAAGRAPEPVAGALGHADFVEQGVGLVRIVARPGIAPLVQVVAVRGRRGGLARRGQAEEHLLVHFAAVDGQRQGAPEAQVLVQLRAPRLLVVLIQHHRHVGRREPRNQGYPIVALLLVLLVEGEVLQARVAVRQVRLAADDLEVVHLLLHHGRDDAVDVGKLVPGGVHAQVVGVALEYAHGGGNLGEAPRLNDRQLDVGRRLPEEVIGERLLPGFVPLLLGNLVGLVVVVDVPLGEVVLRLQHLPVAAVPGGQLDHHLRVRGVELQAHGQVVDPHGVLDERAGLVGHDLGVEVHGDELEHHVVGSDGVAVGPLVPLAQADRHRGIVRCHPHRFGHVGKNLPVDPLEQVGAALDALGHVLPWPVVEGEYPHRAAVLPHLLDRGAHRRVRRQPFVHRRQFPGRHQRGQHRRFAVGAGAGRCGGAGIGGP